MVAQLFLIGRPTLFLCDVGTTLGSLTKYVSPALKVDACEQSEVACHRCPTQCVVSETTTKDVNNFENIS